jgi:hypothetical protein
MPIKPPSRVRFYSVDPGNRKTFIEKSKGPIAHGIAIIVRSIRF